MSDLQMNEKSTSRFVLTGDETEDERQLDRVAETAGLYGRSELIRQVVRDIMKIAPSEVAVLISGESGTGKDLAAKAIHRFSARRHRPLIIVNSGAIAEGILESELFGHEKGAFTGAVSERKGYFEAADGGTIFLDEIGDMPLPTQVKLLRVLETGEFIKVGGSFARTCDVRVLAATHRNLEQMVRKGEFRKDLYYRLKAITISLPPLRSRPIDIPLLTELFAKNTVQQRGESYRGFSAEALDLLARYRWPGNVRELKNFIESLMTLKRGARIEAADITENLSQFSDIDAAEPDEAGSRFLPVPTNLTPEQAERELIYRTLVSLMKEVTELKHYMMSKFGPAHDTHTFGSAVELPALYDKKITPQRVIETEVYNVEDGSADRDIRKIDDMERDAIVQALKRFDGKRSQAARALGLSERTLYRKIKEFKLDL